MKIWFYVYDEGDWCRTEAKYSLEDLIEAIYLKWTKEKVEYLTIKVRKEIEE